MAFRKRMGDDERPVDQSREEAAEKSLRPDIQAGALRMKEGEEPAEHRHPSYRETSDEETVDWPLLELKHALRRLRRA